jgi:hypothetical protein
VVYAPVAARWRRKCCSSAGGLRAARRLPREGPHEETVGLIMKKMPPRTTGHGTRRADAYRQGKAIATACVPEHMLLQRERGRLLEFLREFRRNPRLAELIPVGRASSPFGGIHLHRKAVQMVEPWRTAALQTSNGLAIMH